MKCMDIGDPRGSCSAGIARVESVLYGGGSVYCGLKGSFNWLDRGVTESRLEEDPDILDKPRVSIGQAILLPFERRLAVRAPLSRLIVLRRGLSGASDASRRLRTCNGALTIPCT